MTDLRVGIIGTDNTHGHVYSGYINGWSHDEPIPTSVANYTAAGPTMYRWAATLRELELEKPPRVPIPGARVTRLWSADRAGLRHRDDL
jgi:hypothetical protein